ncbi:MAG TPA: flagellar filament capping protein FliD [Rhodocyclaceae bacterium]|nr:flagellar filament capping protein FliD [Rhodocyclaceae bacterium]
MATGTISSPGLGSGLDVSTIVSQLMSIERLPQRALDSKISSYQAKLSAFGTLTNYLSTLQDSAKAWKSTLKMSATSADTSLFTATASTGAQAGTYAVEVKHLAENNKIRSAAYAVSDTISAGTLNINIGTFDDNGFAAGSRTGNWTYNSTNSVAVNFAGGSILQLRDAINSQASALVSAQVVTADDGMHLVLTSKNKGMDNALTISGTGVSSTLTDLAAFSYDITDLSQNANMAELAIPWSTEVEIDGLTVRSNTNSITGAINGVTLNVLKVSDPGETTTLTVGTDTQSVVDQVNAFIKAYNAVKIGVKTQTNYDPATKVAAPLAGDSSARGIGSQLYTAFSTVPASLNSATYKRLFEIGIKLRNDGNLELDSSKLQEALSTDPAAVMKLLNAYGTQFNQEINRLTDSVKGTLSGRKSGINSTIRDLNTRKDALEFRMGNVEANYRKQFNALDTAMASLQGTMSSLQSQLSGLSRFA